MSREVRHRLVSNTFLSASAHPLGSPTRDRPIRALLRPQRFHRIDARGAQGRYETRGGGNHRQ